MRSFVLSLLFLITLISNLSFAVTVDKPKLSPQSQLTHQQGYSKLSSIMKEKCSNNHGTDAIYKCTLDNGGFLQYLMRYDSSINDASKKYLSKKVWFNKNNEQLIYLEEFSEDGEMKSAIHYDEKQRVKQIKNINGNIELIKIFNLGLSDFESQNEKLNLVEQSVYENGILKSGFKLDWLFDKKSDEKRIKKWTQSVDGEAVSSFDFTITPDCRMSNSQNRIITLLAEGMNMDIHGSRFKTSLYRNTGEQIDGVDNDSNGLVDDCVGFHIDDKGHTRPSGIHPIISDDGGVLQGVNHGTMVADIATRENSQILLYPVSGSIREPLYFDKMNYAIQMNKIRLANLSFTFAKKSSLQLDSRESLADSQSALEKMIEQNPGTLFVAASGNGPFEFPSNMGVNIDSWKQYPASFEYQQILAVGAIEASYVKKEELPNYRLASYSNYGLSSVDVLAPGTGVDMMRPGGLSTETTKGTSFATPFVSNLVSQAMTIYPSLSTEKIKELLIKTVFIPDIDLALKFNLDNSDLKSSKRDIRMKVLNDNPKLLPVRSGGIVFPERFLAATKWLVQNPKKSIEDAALYIRSIKKYQAPTEEGSQEEGQKLIELWRARDL